MKKHILVVDDEIGALTLIGIMLERGGFGVLKAKDARSALGVLDQNTPDMIRVHQEFGRPPHGRAALGLPVSSQHGSPPPPEPAPPGPFARSDRP